MQTEAIRQVALDLTNLMRDNPHDPLDTVVLRRKGRPLVVSQNNLLTQLHKDYCRWRNYITLFDYQKRSNLEKAMLIYNCHVRYLAVTYDVDVNYFLSLPQWVNRWLPMLWNEIAKSNGLPKTDFRKMKSLVGNVQEEVTALFPITLNNKYYYILSKGIQL